MKKILYLFTKGRKERLSAMASALRPAAPREFLFGLPHLREKGYEVDLVEIDDLPCRPGSFSYRWQFWKNNVIGALTGLNSSSHFFHDAEQMLSGYDLIIAANEYIAFGVAALIRKRRLRGKLIFFVMGMLARVAWLERNGHRFYPLAREIYRSLLASAAVVVFIGKGEMAYAEKRYPRLAGNFHFVPFAVDTHFWQPAEPNSAGEGSVLFVGNDKYRDFSCVAGIVRKMTNHRFIVISRNPQLAELASCRHVTVVAGDWKDAVISDAEMRRYYQQAQLVILPLQNTLQPSGQSVALQAMACGKAVLMTRTEGFWEPGVFVHDRHLIFIEENDPDLWRTRIMTLLADRGRLTGIGRAARQLMEANNNLDLFGQRLLKCLHGPGKETL
ncbi:MAG: glycosyltransferase family 4 protein [Thermodesulfobacteriota bacterium]